MGKNDLFTQRLSAGLSVGDKGLLCPMKKAVPSKDKQIPGRYVVEKACRV